MPNVRKEDNYIVVLVTIADVQAARQISRWMVEKKLAACTSLVHGVESTYWWQGKVEENNEYLLILKTKMTLLDELVTAVKQVHSYNTPEIIALPIVGGSPEYLRWLGETVKFQDQSQKHGSKIPE